MAGESISQGGRIIVSSLRLFYEYLGFSVLLSILWFVLAFVPSWFLLVVLFSGDEAIDPLGRLIVGLLLFLFVAFWSGPLTVGVYAVTHRLAARDYVAVREIFHYFARFYGRAVRMSAAVFAIVALMLINLYFYLVTGPQLFPNLSAFLQIVGLIWLQFTAFVFFAAQWTAAVLVQQEVPLLKILQRSALIALDNLVASILILAAIALLAAAFTLRLPFMLAFAGLVGFIHNVGLTEIMKKYDDPSAPPQPESTA